MKEQNASGKGSSKPKVASNTVFNTGGGSQTKRAKPKAKKAPAQVVQQAPARPRVQRGKVQKTEVRSISFENFILLIFDVFFENFSLYLK